MTREFNKKREPLFHIVRRTGMPWWEALLIRLGGILLGFIVICILFQATTVEKNPFAIIGQIFNGCFRKFLRFFFTHEYLTSSSKILHIFYDTFVNFMCLLIQLRRLYQDTGTFPRRHDLL